MCAHLHMCSPQEKITLLMPVVTESTRVNALRSLAFKRSLLSPRRVSSLLDLPVERVYDGIRHGWIPFTRINGAIFVHPRQLREWLGRIDGSREGMPIMVQSRPVFRPHVVVIAPQPMAVAA